MKWFVEQPDSPRALAALKAHRFAAPALIQVELANALWKYVRFSRFDPAGAAETVAAFPRYAVLHDIAGLAPAAFQLAVAHYHPVYDMLYAALARELGAPLLTADQKLAAVCRSHDLCEARLLSDMPEPS